MNATYLILSLSSLSLASSCLSFTSCSSMSLVSKANWSLSSLDEKFFIFLYILAPKYVNFLQSRSLRICDWLPNVISKHLISRKHNNKPKIHTFISKCLQSTLNSNNADNQSQRIWKMRMNIL